MKKVLFLILCLLGLLGCSVQRLNSWNADDAKSMAEKQASIILNDDWFTRSGERSPALVLAPLENFSGNGSTLFDLENALARELLLKAKVRLVRPKMEKGDWEADASFWQSCGAEAVLKGQLELVPHPKMMVYRLTLEMREVQTDALLHRSQTEISKPKWQAFGSSV